MKRALDIAELLRKCVDEYEWKGDSHAHGVYFTDDKGYMLSKVLAARINHTVSEGGDLFYSFQRLDEEGFPIVKSEYPFQNLITKPKKHFLLFDKPNLSKERLHELFEVPFEYSFKIEPKRFIELYEKGTRRERERCAAKFVLEAGQLRVEIIRTQSRKSRIVHHVTMPILACEPTEAEGVFYINAHTILYVIEIFSSKPYVQLKVGSDRIMVTEGNEPQTAHLEVLISKMRVRS